VKATRQLVIAIDGPAGSGKSTIAARLARRLGYVNLESGAMYRALALKALEQHVGLDEAEPLRELAEQTRIELEPLAEGNRVVLDGREVSARIRQADVTAAASRVSVHAPVRKVLVARQRELGANGGVVMEGRDIGTSVFPNADVKIFLDANPFIRAERRVLQSGVRSTEETKRILEELADRDERDRSRPASPLIAASDAVTIDTTHKSIDDVMEEIERIVKQKSRGEGFREK